MEKSEPIGVVVLNSETTLGEQLGGFCASMVLTSLPNSALLTASDRTDPMIPGSDPKIRNIVETSRIEGPDVIPASLASDKLFVGSFPSYEPK